MRTFDTRKGNKIISVVYSHEPKGLGFRELQRKAGFSSRRTVELVLNHLRNLEIIRQQPRIPIHLTASAIEKYKQGIQLLYASPKRDKHEPESVFTKKQRIEVAKKEKEKQNIYIRIVAIAHLGSSYSKQLRKGAKIEAGDRPVNDLAFFLKHRKLSYPIYRNYLTPGVGMQDIINKKLRANERAQYLPSNVKPPSLLFAYIPVTEEDAKRHLRKLIERNPPILKPIDSKSRYEIADPQLCEFVSKCLILLYRVRDRMKRSLTYEKSMRRTDKAEYIKWLDILYGDRRKSISFLEAADEKIGFKEKYSKSPHELKQIKDSTRSTIRGEDISIKTLVKELTGHKFAETRKIYSIITEHLLDLAYPMFLKEIHKRQR